MSNLSRSAHLYLRVLLMRQEVTVRATARKIALGFVASLFLLGGIALANVALFYWLAPRFGDMGAAGLLAVLQLAIGAVVLWVALAQTESRELVALRETEQAALSLLAQEAESITSFVTATGRSADKLGRNLATGMELAKAIVGLMGGRKSPGA
jgi:hypothetical protein